MLNIFEDLLFKGIVPHSAKLISFVVTQKLQDAPYNSDRSTE